DPSHRERRRGPALAGDRLLAADRPCRALPARGSPGVRPEPDAGGPARAERAPGLPSRVTPHVVPRSAAARSAGPILGAWRRAPAPATAAAAEAPRRARDDVPRNDNVGMA